MTKSLLEHLDDSLEEARAVGKGERLPTRVTRYTFPNVKEIRDVYGVSQAKFAAMLGISQRTLEGWEQGRRRPKGPARQLLEVAQRFPEAVFRTAFEQQETEHKNATKSPVRATTL